MYTSKKLKLDIFCLLLQAHLSPNNPLPCPISFLVRVSLGRTDSLYPLASS